MFSMRFGRHAACSSALYVSCGDLLLSCRNSFVEKYAEKSFWVETCQAEQRLYFGRGGFVDLPV